MNAKLFYSLNRGVTWILFGMHGKRNFLQQSTMISYNHGNIMFSDDGNNFDYDGFSYIPFNNYKRMPEEIIPPSKFIRMFTQKGLTLFGASYSKAKFNNGEITVAPLYMQGYAFKDFSRLCAYFNGIEWFEVYKDKNNITVGGYSNAVVVNDGKVIKKNVGFYNNASYSADLAINDSLETSIYNDLSFKYDFKNPIICFEKVLSAINYHVQVSRNPNFSSLVYNDSLVYSTKYVLDLIDTNKYYIRIRPRNVYGRGKWSKLVVFVSGSTLQNFYLLQNILKNHEADKNNFFDVQYFPNPFIFLLTLSIYSKMDGLYVVKLYDILGREMKSFEINSLKSGEVKNLYINLNNEFASGVYLCVVSVKTANNEKLV